MTTASKATLTPAQHAALRVRVPAALQEAPADTIHRHRAGRRAAAVVRRHGPAAAGPALRGAGLQPPGPGHRTQPPGHPLGSHLVRSAGKARPWSAVPSGRASGSFRAFHRFSYMRVVALMACFAVKSGEIRAVARAARLARCDRRSARCAPPWRGVAIEDTSAANAGERADAGDVEPGPQLTGLGGELIRCAQPRHPFG